MTSWFPTLLLATLIGSAGACMAMSDATGAPDDGVGDGGSVGSVGAGAEGPDGSIDVAPDGNPAPAPLDYANLCGLPAAPDTTRVCVAGADSDGCNAAQGVGGGGRGPVSSSCQLIATDAGVSFTCGVPGSAEYNQPCMDATNCKPGLGCAIAAGPNSTAGACLDYCCGDLEECPKDTYCAPQSMTEAPDLSIPVCILASKCTLLDDSTCPPDLTCAIVRADGTTSCVVPGTGKDGEPCTLGACAPGFTCLKLANTCKQLCRLDHPEDCPMGSTCLSGSGEYPDNYGTCTAGDGYN